MPFDRRWLISFMAIVLMRQTYKRLQKTQVVGLQKLKWLNFFCLTNAYPLYDRYERTQWVSSILVICLIKSQSFCLFIL